MALLITALPANERGTLLAQLDDVQVISDRYMSIELNATSDVQRVHYKDGPLPVRGDVMVDGKQAGTVALWVRRGVISLLCYGSYSGDMPTTFPRVHDVLRVRLTAA